MPGTTSPMTRPVRARITGVRMVSPVSAMRSSSVLRAGSMERQGSDPQGAPVRPDEQRGQSRRGCQGVLLLSRQHADSFVHEVSVQVSAGGLPLRGPDRDQQARNRGDMEYELLDTGIFDGDRYFDVFVEYAKQTPEDILIQISVCNRGPEAPRYTSCRLSGSATHGLGGPARQSRP